MVNVHRFTIMLFLLVTSFACAGQVHKIAPDLYAYISSNDSSANSTFIVSDAGILVVDTGLNEVEGKKLLAAVRKISAAPVRWIVNTHYHPDHRGGNIAFGPDAAIISTLFTREHVLNFADKAQVIHSNVGLNLIVNTSLTLFVGEHRVEIYHPGPAHTGGDLVVYFPDQRTVARGDLFLTNSCPAMDEGDMENWITSLDKILALPVEHVVPGHFELASKVDLRLFRDYLSELGQQVRDMRAEGLSREQIKKVISLPQFASFRQYPQYEATFADNAEAYYNQLSGRPR
jgi:cyclase